ncbi:hypothetical protein FACS1894186_1440 [Alphaproteobacteria bacterium]|nr:hypothetical protein FACS1894186_1440 [Alphaproteobacteria bacterium]
MTRFFAIIALCLAMVSGAAFAQGAGVGKLQFDPKAGGSAQSVPVPSGSEQAKSQPAKPNPAAFKAGTAVPPYIPPAPEVRGGYLDAFRDKTQVSLDLSVIPSDAAAGVAAVLIPSEEEKPVKMCYYLPGCKGEIRTSAACLESKQDIPCEGACDTPGVPQPFGCDS